MTRALSIAHLTFLDLAPPALIRLAGQAGFDAVGLRLIAVTETTPGYPLMHDARMMQETLAALRDTGVTVNDIEFVRITPEFAASQMDAFLQAGAALGAKHIVTAPYDPDLGRLADSLAAFADRAAPYGLTPVLEFFPWTSVPDLATALQVVESTGVDGLGVLLDTLHFNRSNSALQDISDASPARFPFVHLCDAEVRPSYTEPELLHTARAARLMPGDGAIPLGDILARLPQDIPVGLEVPIEDRPAGVGDLDVARALLDKSRSVLDSAGR